MLDQKPPDRYSNCDYYLVEGKWRTARECRDLWNFTLAKTKAILAKSDHQRVLGYHSKQRPSLIRFGKNHFTEIVDNQSLEFMPRKNPRADRYEELMRTTLLGQWLRRKE